VAVVLTMPPAADAVYRISVAPASAALALASGLVEVGEEAADTAGDALVPVDFAFPAALASVGGQLLFQAEAGNRWRAVGH
jgi:hypothetical protein